MLGLCTNHLNSIKSSYGSTFLRLSEITRTQGSRWSVLRPGTVSSTIGRSTQSNSTLSATQSLTTSANRRLYANSRDPNRKKLGKAMRKLEDNDETESGHLSLEHFFESDQKVGETRVVKKKLKKHELEAPEGEELELPSDLDEQRLVEASLRDRLGATESELEMAMGLSSFHAMDRKARHRPVKTVAIEKLQQRGEFDLSELSDLDYDSLKSFALEHEIKMEEFFTKTRTASGEITELKMPLGNQSEMEEFEEGREGLIEHSREYLRTARPSTKNFRDRIRVRCMAGGGGKGGVSFYRDTRVHKGPPDGGDGGEGGSVIFMAAENKKPSLASLQPSYRGGAGMPGSRTRRKGKSGADVIIEVPLGTTITEFRSKPKDEFGDDLTPQHQNEDESPEAPSSQSDFFSGPPRVPRDSSMEEADNDNGGSDLDGMEARLSAETQLWRKEEGHRKLYADPRVGRPWAPPSLPEDHPLQQSASDFHKMISQYENIPNSEGSPQPDMTLSKSATQAPPPLLSGSSKSTKGKAAASSHIMPGYEDYYEEEMRYEDEFVSGSDLVEKYRLKGPAETQVKASNAPRSVELDEPGAYFIAAKGGAGGLGNWRLAAVRNRPQAIGTPGKPGESLIYQLELKLIADVGLVGFPNAGKSTFLSNVSRANPKIASYPFTTLCPEIGTVNLEDGTQFTIADLPGLIEGAHANRGLGHQFLKHIERTSALVFVIDMSGGDNREPWKSFITLWDELERYQKGLAKKPAIIVANKMDAGAVSQENLKSFSKHLKSDKEFKNLKVYPISASSKMNMGSAINALRRLLGYPDSLPATEKGRKFSKRAEEVRSSGFMTFNVASHLSEALKNIK